MRDQEHAGANTVINVNESRSHGQEILADIIEELAAEYECKFLIPEAPEEGIQGFLSRCMALCTFLVFCSTSGSERERGQDVLHARSIIKKYCTRNQ